MKEAIQTFSGFAGEKQAHNDINISLYRHRSDVPLSGKCALCGKSSRSGGSRDALSPESHPERPASCRMQRRSAAVFVVYR
ncbi:hypothetical protein GOC19_19335 [Sinorhizobium meliloti]|nr:hypothetical protein [Sinorhizobium meliloti]